MNPCELTASVTAVANTLACKLNNDELAVYHCGITGGYTGRTIEIWIPIEKK